MLNMFPTFLILAANTHTLYMVVQAWIHVVIMVNSNAIYNDIYITMAMLHVLLNNFGSSCWQNVSLLVLPYRMLHRG